MNSNKEKQTEYDGHLYDSRAKAIFARVNDLMQRRNADAFPFKFRPTLLDFAGHRWDLCIDKFVPIMAEILGTRNYYEYQERRPSDEFIKSISESAIAWGKQARENEDQFVAVYFSLVWGNPFDLARRGQTYQCMCLATNFEESDAEVVRDFGEPDLIAEAIEYPFNHSDG